MERGLAALATVFTVIAVLLISTVYGARFFDVLGGQALTVNAILGVGSAIVAAVLFGSAAIVDTIKGRSPVPPGEGRSTPAETRE